MEMETGEVRDTREFVEAARHLRLVRECLDHAFDAGAVMGLRDRFHAPQPSKRAGEILCRACEVSAPWCRTVIPIPLEDPSGCAVAPPRGRCAATVIFRDPSGSAVAPPRDRCAA